MTSASSRAVFLLVVQPAAVFMRRLVRLVSTFLHKLCLAVLRAIITGLVFATCAMVMLNYLGLPVPGPSELLDKFEDLSRLAEILS